jgi:hypothetical protein
MPIFFTSPTFARPGVVAGFTLVAPLADTPASGPVSFTFYSANTTVNGQALTITTGFTHWVQVGSLTYSYVQTSTDTPTSIATALAALMNGTPDPNAIASSNGAVLKLTPREDTDAPVVCYASEAYQAKGVLQAYTLVELTGNNLIPTLTKGVLFAQGEMYRPAQNPVVPAAPASRQSWLFYSSSAGFYWQANSTPTVSDDALIGWVVTNAAQIVAFSSRRIGNGEEAIIRAPLSALLIEGASGDTGLPPAFNSVGIQCGVPNMDPGQLKFVLLGFATSQNVAGVTSGTFLVYYIDELQAPIGTLTAALAPTDTHMSVSAPLPAPGPGSVVFTFLNSGVVGGVTIGPGYEHNIAIGTAVYQYQQQTGDTAAMVAAGLAQVIQALADANAIAEVNGATVILAPRRDDGTTVACTASDGNAPQTLTEMTPTYVLVEGIEGLSWCGEIIEVRATDGSSIVRGAKGCGVQTFSAGGERVWAVKETTLFFTLPGESYGTPAWPGETPAIPFRSKGLVAVDMWATNEFGDGPVWTVSEADSPFGGRVRSMSTVQVQMSVQGTLAIGSNAATRCVSPALAASVLSISASVESAPVGAPITCTINVNGAAWVSFAIPTTITPGQVTNLVTMFTTPGVDTMILPANANMTLDITGVGTTNPGSGLLVVVCC